MTEDPASGEWHVDKRIPAALIITLGIAFVAQTFAVGVWVSQLSQRLSSVERTIDQGRDTAARLVKVEIILERLERKVDKLAP